MSMHKQQTNIHVSVHIPTPAQAHILMYTQHSTATRLRNIHVVLNSVWIHGVHATHLSCYLEENATHSCVAVCCRIDLEQYSCWIQVELSLSRTLSLSFSYFLTLSMYIYICIYIYVYIALALSLSLCLSLFLSLSLSLSVLASQQCKNVFFPLLCV